MKYLVGYTGNSEEGMHGLLSRVDLSIHGLSVLAMGKALKYFESGKPWKVLKDNARIENSFVFRARGESFERERRHRERRGKNLMGGVSRI